MALTKCRECEKEVSDQALSCPGCGCPMVVASPVDEGRSSGGVFEFVGFALILGGLVSCMASDDVGSGSSLALVMGFCVFLAGRFMR